MTNYYCLNPDEQITSPNAPQICKSFYIDDNSLKVFAFTDQSLISSVHICGDSGIKHDNAAEVYVSDIQLDENFIIIEFEEELRRYFRDYSVLHCLDAIMIKTKNIKERNSCASALVKLESREKVN